MIGAGALAVWTLAGQAERALADAGDGAGRGPGRGRADVDILRVERFRFGPAVHGGAGAAAGQREQREGQDESLHGILLIAMTSPHFTGPGRRGAGRGTPRAAARRRRRPPAAARTG